VIATLGAVLVATALAVLGSQSLRAASGRAQAGAGSGPGHWPSATISSGAATLAYPPGWRRIPGDTGTVTAALRDHAGRYLGYLNVTPRQGAERLAGWAAFRIARNREEGDKRVRMLAASQGVRFIAARGSCVVDQYQSRVGQHRYRELACIVSGRAHTSVFVGAALVSSWSAIGPILTRAASVFLER
jgi:hypothetical protein